jgi:hypothetical protein
MLNAVGVADLPATRRLVKVHRGSSLLDYGVSPGTVISER